MKKFPFFITVFALISASVPAAYAWTNPTANPASGAGAVFVEAGAAANAIYIKSNGNVGIGGTTNPGYKLSVQGPYSSPQALIGYDGSNGIFFQAQGTTTHTNWLIGQQRTVSGLEFVPSTTAGGITFSTPAMVILSANSNVGIGTTTPTQKLDVNGTIKATSFEGALSGTTSAANVSSGDFGSNTGGGNYTFPAAVYIGAISSGSAFQISNSNQFRVYVSEGIILPTYYYLGDIAYGNGTLKVSGILSGHTQSQGRADVNLTFSVRDAFTALGSVWGKVGTGSDIVVYNDTVASKYKVYLKTDDYGLVNLNLTAVSGASVGYTGSGSTTAPAYTLAYTLSTDAGGIIRSLTDGNVGIGIIPTADPSGYNLDVGPGGSYTARLGTSSADTVLIGGGAGKLNVGTIDPIYTIGAKRYATYVTAMTGVKEETSGTIRLQKTGNRYIAELDFGSAEEGSDLWLFYQVADFYSEWSGLSVLLSSGFDGSVWYEKDAAKKVVRIYGEPIAASALSSGVPMEVSYRLTAPRFDHKKWSNYSEDGAEGFKLDVKE